MKKQVALLKGDGIGPEITGEAVKVLRKVSERFGHTFVFHSVAFGGCALDRYGVPLTDEGLAVCQKADSVLLGAVGGPKWDAVSPSLRPEKALLTLRKKLGLFANVRPTRLFPSLADSSPLKKEITGRGIDFVIVRELIGGVYFGDKKREKQNGEEIATDLMSYATHEIERIGRVAFEMAQKRRKHLTSVDKANVLETSRLWRETMHRLSADYPDVTYRDLYVDNAAMQLIRDPSQFDVVVTENLFGDILSDEASVLTGSIGMMPSASLSEGSVGLFEPIHGSAPDIAGKNIANPLGTILSAAMMLRYAFGMDEEAEAVEQAVSAVLDQGFRTADTLKKGCTTLSCSAMGDAVADRI